MSFYAFGSGCLQIYTECDSGGVVDALKEAGFFFYEEQAELQEKHIYPSYHSKFREDILLDCFDRIKGRIYDGIIEFTGEGTDHWCYVFKNGEYHEEYGTVLYEGDLDAVRKSAVLDASAHGLSVRTLRDAFSRFILAEYDGDASDSEHLRHVLLDICELTPETVRLMGFDWLVDLWEESADGDRV